MFMLGVRGRLASDDPVRPCADTRFFSQTPVLIGGGRWQRITVMAEPSLEPSHVPRRG